MRSPWTHPSQSVRGQERLDAVAKDLRLIVVNGVARAFHIGVLGILRTSKCENTASVDDQTGYDRVVELWDLTPKTTPFIRGILTGIAST